MCAIVSVSHLWFSPFWTCVRLLITFHYNLLPSSYFLLLDPSIWGDSRRSSSQRTTLMRVWMNELTLLVLFFHRRLSNSPLPPLHSFLYFVWTRTNQIECVLTAPERNSIFSLREWSLDKRISCPRDSLPFLPVSLQTLIIPCRNRLSHCPFSPVFLCASLAICTNFVVRLSTSSSTSFLGLNCLLLGHAFFCQADARACGVETNDQYLSYL